MRDYGKVYTAFWSNQDMRDMSEDARMLALYLMTCPHGNMLGCFRLPDAYAAEDMKWSVERVSEGFAELFANGFAYRCQRTFWVFIHKYLEWNQFENPNVGKAAGKLFDSLSAPLPIKAMLINSLATFAPVFPAEKITAFKTLCIPFENPFDLSSKTVVVAKPEPQPEPEPNQPHGAVAPDVAVERRAENVEIIAEQVPLEVVVEKITKPRGDAGDDVRAVFTYWQQAMGHNRAQLDAKREKAIRARLKDGYSVGDLCLAVDGCRKSPHHMGKNDTSTVFDDIELICRDGPRVDGFIKKAGLAAPTGISSNQQQTFDALNRYLERDES